MIAKSLHRNSLEILESRIAPASAIATADFLPAKVGGYDVLHAGQGLSTAGSNAGIYLLYVEKGTAIVFNTDFNHNGVVDFNEITGIAAGDGLRLISFVDIHGDIVTNLDADGTLSDSNNNASDNDKVLQGDGRVLNNNRIEKIELRSLTTNDLTDQNADGVVDNNDVALRLALSSYSIFGNVYAGKGFGVPGDASSGLIIDDAGTVLQQGKFTGLGVDYYYDFKPSVDSIRTGSAASFEHFSFGLSENADVQGQLVAFTAPSGQVGGDIAGVKSTGVKFNLNSLVAGQGGQNARGGNIQDVTMNSDTAGGYHIIAGNGGIGATGGGGGSILNFQDLGSETGEVIVQSGTAGTATSGVGGDGGTIGLGTFNVNGPITITLGDGGDGFTAGGNGASLTRAVITTPEGNIDHVLSIVGSTHDSGHDPATGKTYGSLQDPNIIDPVTGKPYTRGEIGRTRAVDFNHDGFGDAVFSTDNPDQLIVVFGDGVGGFTTTRISLDAPTTPEAVTVADFNGDGFMDIVVASNFQGNFDGPVTFLAKTEDVNGDGILTQVEDVNHNGANDFLGFQSGRHSTLPALFSGDPDGGVSTSPLGPFYGYRRSAVAINDIEAGDFNGDGFMDIAVAATYTDALLRPRQIIMFLVPEIENGRPTGQFYADMGTKATGEPPAGADPWVPIVLVGAPGDTKSIIESTSMTTSSNHDVLVGEALGFKSVFVFDNYPIDPLIPGKARSGSLGGPSFTGTSLGKVDTDRLLGPNHIALSDATLKDLTIVDGSGPTSGNPPLGPDGIADLAVIDNANAGTVVIKQGNGVSFPTFLTNDAVDNAGLFFGTPNGFGFPTDLAHIRATDFDGDGKSDQIVVAAYGDPAASLWNIIGVDINDVVGGVVANPGGTFMGAFSSGIAFTHDSTPRGFDLWTVNLNAPAAVDYLIAQPGQDDPIVQLHDIESTTFAFIEATQHFLNINAGNGGSALLGRGGAGGFLGGSLTSSPGLDPVTGLPGADVVGAVSITLPAELQNAGFVNLIAGTGGDGFTKGGQGGDVRGVTVRYVSTATNLATQTNLTAGDGGIAVSGPGGAGGSLVANSIVLGLNFTAGDGGRGLTGGDGGSIIGNGQKSRNVRIFDNRNSDQFLIAGEGGDGIKRGGAGGTISNFAASLDLAFIGFEGGSISYVAGDGGNATAGPGGKGGSVVNSSPVLGENRLGGDILLQGGHGGDGTTGGAGGGVNTFVNKPSTSAKPAVLSVIGGDGGRGVSGLGGRGGDITGIDVPTNGKHDPAIPPLTNYGYDRILAGNGGLSSGGVGGAGGAISNVNASNSDNPFVVAAGAGGAGLRRGGDGGSVLNTTIEVGGSSLSKLLVIAGAGGDASAFLANPNDGTVFNQPDKAFGGSVGRGGNGGNISNFTQGSRSALGVGGNANARVDLIAGNGGDTVNYGTVDSVNVPVGKGGSITNVALAGSIGNVSNTVPIKNYNNDLAGETMTDFVNSHLRDPQTPGSIDDSIGNVGLIAGAAGRLKVITVGFGNQGEIEYRSQPAQGGINGSVNGITARNIMSMVAGSVDRLAAIQVLSNIKVTGVGDVGTDKPPLGVPQYLTKAGTIVTQPELDGSLLDGAVVYRKALGKLPIGAVFQLA